MAMHNLMETTLPELYSRELYDEKLLTLSAIHTDKIAEVVFTATSEALKDTKSKDYPVAFVFDNPSNMEVYAAAIVRYIPNEDESMPGHWNYVWTFEKEDIPDNARIIRLSDGQFQSYFRSCAMEKQFGFHDSTCLNESCTVLIKNINQWLHDNASEEEEIGIKLDGVFQARAIVEDNEVVKSIELLGETKAIIKDDAGSEV